MCCARVITWSLTVQCLRQHTLPRTVLTQRFKFVWSFDVMQIYLDDNNNNNTMTIFMVLSSWRSAIARVHPVHNAEKCIGLIFCTIVCIFPDSQFAVFCKIMIFVAWVPLICSYKITMFQYETVEGAVATRQALHGKRWPASNPKVLGVEFRNMEEVLYLTFCLIVISVWPQTWKILNTRGFLWTCKTLREFCATSRKNYNKYDGFVWTYICYLRKTTVDG